MANGILVFGEIRDGALKPIHRELIAAAKELSGAGGGPVSIAVVGGNGVDAALDAARASGGLGLGLSISRRLARSMGGDLLLEQRQQQACFVLALPVAI